MVREDGCFDASPPKFGGGQFSRAQFERGKTLDWKLRTYFYNVKIWTPY